MTDEQRLAEIEFRLTAPKSHGFIFTRQQEDISFLLALYRAERERRERADARTEKHLKERDEALGQWHAHQKNVPCPGCEGGHDTFWGTVIKSPQWKAWVDSRPDFDVFECEACGHISQRHFQAFLDFCAKQPAPKEAAQ